jgi:cytidine deaminase
MDNNEQKIWKSLFEAARAVQGSHRLSDYVTAGEVAAAVESSTGKIYTGVCVDTACTLGICAERNAIFNMLTHGEHKIRRVLAIMPNGKNGAPCGACRELMVQLMPKDYGMSEIMLDLESMKTMRMAELTPEWWIK